MSRRFNLRTWQGVISLLVVGLTATWVQAQVTHSRQQDGCCLPDGRCIDVLPQICLSLGGSPQETPCMGMIRACCLPDGMCIDADPLCCDELGGWIGYLPNCMGDLNGNNIDDACEQGPAFEACCLPDGACVMVPWFDCDAMLGVWQGPGTACTQPETCCLPDGMCIDVDPLCCDEMGGSFGYAPNCLGDLNGNDVDDACEPEEPEACCLPDGACMMVFSFDCLAMRGVPQGPGTVCTQPAACCLPDGTCIDADPLCCDELGGWIGYLPNCLGDLNGNGVDDACEPPCEPQPDGLGCSDVPCPDATEVCLPRVVRHHPPQIFFPPAGLDLLTPTSGHIAVQDPTGMTMSYPILPDVAPNFTEGIREDPVDEGGFRTITMEMVQLELVAGGGGGGGAIAIHLNTDAGMVSPGQTIGPVSPDTDFPAESFFDVFVKIDFSDVPGAQGLWNMEPIPLWAHGITAVPPLGAAYGTEASWPGVDLLDAFGDPTGYRIIQVVHILPPPPQEWEVIECECVDREVCHVEFDGIPYCTGFCPDGEECEQLFVTNPDGSVDVSCHCVPCHDTVVCEPQAPQNPTHPVTYWYDVTVGNCVDVVCDFHVRVFDPDPTNYTNPTLPPGNWQFAVHQVAGEWWASWWTPDCESPLWEPAFFRFQFDNPNPNTWSHWLTTYSGDNDPYTPWVGDRSENHADEPDGYGYRVHVPVAVPAEAKWSQPPGEPSQSFDAASDLWWVEPELVVGWEQRPNPQLSGLHAHDWSEPGAYRTIVLADDWPWSQDMPVSDLHWWGNYELDEFGMEKRGDGVMFFNLSIHMCGGGFPWCLPFDPPLWSMRVPFNAVHETATGLYNVEGCMIYRYDYVLTPPFIPQGTPYFWLDVMAVADNPENPPIWRWQEARRGAAPPLGHAPAAESSNGMPWQSITWGADPERYSDMAFQITKPVTVLPNPLPNKVVADDFISDGRPIQALRWWGSYLDSMYAPDTPMAEPYVLDGWLIAFHHKDPVLNPGCPPDLLAGDPHPTVLGVYFAPVEAVSIEGIDMADCLGHPVYEYVVDLAQCCLLCSQVDPRPDADVRDPAQPGAFLETRGFGYWLSIQAVTGVKWTLPHCTYEERILTGHLPSPNEPDGHFWGWHTSPGPYPPCDPMNTACNGRIVDFSPYPPECWDYGAWDAVNWLCDDPPRPVHMAFDLLTRSPRPCGTCPGDLNGDGVVNGLDIQGFVDCLLGNPIPVGVDCACGDFNCTMTVEMGDVQPFVQELLNTTVCPAGGAYLAGSSHSGCLPGSRDGWCDPDAFVFTVTGGTLHTLHHDATYNCCPDDIVVHLDVQGSVLLMTEEEILSQPCYCLCCYDVEATVEGLSPGEYLVRYCYWEDETGSQECYEETMVVP